MARVTSKDLAAKGTEGCVVESRDGDTRGWSRIPGDASGWTLAGARKALRDYVRGLDLDDVSDSYRITRGGKEVERYLASDLRSVG